MTPAQLSALVAEHNAMHTPGGKRARATNDPADLLAIAAMRRSG